MRDLMIKHPNSKLWEKHPKDWTKKDKKEFELMQKGTLLKREKRVATNATKVIRVKDGKIYSSIFDCRGDNNLYKVKMSELLELGIEFKKL